MANALTALAPTLFTAAKEVAAEPTGVLSAINMDFDDKGVAIGDAVSIDVAPTRTISPFVPAATAGAGDDATAGKIDVTITRNEKVSWNLTGEQSASLDNGTISQDWVAQLIKNGMRALRNAAEADAAIAVKVGASRAYGVAGTTPFATDLTALRNARNILKKNGAPMIDLHCVYDSDADLNLSGLNIIQQANQAGSDAERRSGIIGQQFGFNLTDSAQIATHTKGTGAGYLVNSVGGLAVGTTTIPVDTGAGTIIEGDVITGAGDGNKYVVKTALAGGVVEIQSPGLLVAWADNAAVTVGANYVANLAFERSAVVGIMRPPHMPENPTIKKMMISDDRGLSYLLVDIAQDGMRTWRLHSCWGFKTVNGEFSSLILG